MSVEITLPDHIIGDVLSDISGKRGGRVLGIKSVMARFSESDNDQVDMRRKCLNALIPLSEMVGYTTYLRSISKGEASFVMNFSHYERLSGQKQSDVLNNPRMY
jgi:elongation factor G